MDVIAVGTAGGLGEGPEKLVPAASVPEQGCGSDGVIGGPGAGAVVPVEVDIDVIAPGGDARGQVADLDRGVGRSLGVDVAHHHVVVAIGGGDRQAPDPVAGVVGEGRTLVSSEIVQEVGKASAGACGVVPIGFHDHPGRLAGSHVRGRAVGGAARQSRC